MARSATLKRGTLIALVVITAAMAVWVFMNRSAIAAACLNTISGVTSKVAHLNQPFGSGSAVVHKNPILGVVPDFTLTGHDGRKVTKSDLMGGYWIASFIFTRCATTCPMAVMELDALQSDLPSDVRLVSISVDPEHDTPGVLADYASKVGADVDRWVFLTGEKSSIYRYVREGFHLAVQENDDGRPGWEVTHTPRFALVDPRGRIRGYYDSSDGADLDRLRADVERLLGSSNDSS